MSKIQEATIVLSGEGPDIETLDRADAPAIWAGYKSEFEKLKESADQALLADPSLPLTSKQARLSRLAIRQVRLAIESKRKELGEVYLRKTQAINSEAKALKELIEPYKAKLLEIEGYAERIEAERKAKLSSERVEAISKFTQVSSAINYAELTDEEFDRMLADAEAAYNLRQAEAKRVEEVRLAREKIEAEERERVRLENEKLRAEAEAREKLMAEERAAAAKKQAEAEAAARKEREAIEAKAQAEREALEAKAAKERAEAAEVARKEREAREKLEAEVAAKEKAEADRLAKIAHEEEERKLAPDRIKLLELAITLRSVELPDFTTAKANTLKGKIAESIESLAVRIETAANNMK